ncbi:MAG: hypothetical protein FJ295_15395 [Planctomycetes bacterium]|nr:hypothetical protein [Planctomycetota bacterium]
MIDRGWSSVRLPVLLAALLAMQSVGADTATGEAPSVSYIFPAGGQRGTQVQFRIGGHFLHGHAALDMTGPGVAASTTIKEGPTTWFEGPLVVKPASQAAENYPRDHYGEVALAKDAPLGAIAWRVSTSQGATPGRPFVVGDLPEVIEEEMDGMPLPQSVMLPVTINGRIFPREDVDIWTFAMEQGQQVACEVLAARIGSSLDSQLEIRAPDGSLIAENGDSLGIDSRIQFTAPVSGVYQARIWDAEFRGLQEFVYRLTIRTDSFVERVFPLGGRRGETVAFRLIDAPEDRAAVRPMLLAPPSTGLQWVHLPLGDRFSNPVLVDVGDAAEVVESHNADGSGRARDVAAEQDGEVGKSPARPLELPVSVNGMISQVGETDRWLVRGTKGQAVEYELLTQRLGSSLDAVLSVFPVPDPGTQAATPPAALVKVGSTVDNPQEPKGLWEFPNDGLFAFEVADVSGTRGGPSYTYRLRMVPPPQPDFRLRALSDAVTVVRGGESKFKVAIDRIGGFAGEVKLNLVGLSDGVTLSGNSVPANAAESELTLKADARAKVQALFLDIDGTAELAPDKVLTRRAVMPALQYVPARESLLLVVAMPTPFKLDGGELQIRYGARGTVFRRPFKIERNGYQGTLNVRLADRQIRHLQGVTGPTLVLGPDVQEFEYPVRLPTWLETNRTSRTVLMVTGEVLDNDGTPHTVSFSSGDTRNQIALLTAPCPLSVRAEATSMRALVDGKRSLPVSVSRGTLSPEEVRIELLVPPHTHGVMAEPITLARDVNGGLMSIQFAKTAGPFTLPLTIRATTVVDGDPVIAETALEVVDAR